MIFFTHLYDFIAKLGSLILGGLLSYLLFSPYRPGPVFNVLFALGTVTLAFLLYLWRARTLGSLAYCRFSLGGKFTFAQARQFNGVLAPLTPVPWYPMWHVRFALPEDKLAEAVRAADAWKEERRQFQEERTRRLKIRSLPHRVIYGILGALILVGFIAGFFVIPPTDKLARLLASFSDDGTFNPMFNGLIVCLIPCIFLHLMNMRLGIYPHHVTAVGKPDNQAPPQGEEDTR